VKPSAITARFSPGPWWGFNGIDFLELSDGILTRKHLRLSRGYVPVNIPVSRIDSVSYKVRVGKNGQAKWVRMTLRIGWSKKTFTGRIVDGEPFAEALSKVVAFNPFRDTLPN
jgi:hypothetical protein